MVSTAPSCSSSAAAFGKPREDPRGALLERCEVAEHYRLDVQLRHAFHASPGGGVVIAVQAARERDASEASLEGVTHEQDAVARAVEADAAGRVPGGMDDLEATQHRQDLAVLDRNDTQRLGG